MTKETSKMVLETLANHRIYNTNDCYSISVHDSSFRDYEHVTLYLYPQDGFPWFLDSVVSFVLSVASAFYVRCSFGCKQGLPVIYLS